MVERIPISIIFQGEPFDQSAVIHTLRHLAMRAGWTLRPDSPHRIIYATFENPQWVEANPEAVVILSSPDVGRHLQNSTQPIPLTFRGKNHLPFLHPLAESVPTPNWIPADVIAGAFAVLNLWYEGRTRPRHKDGWLRSAEDWWTRSGFSDPQPVADEWLDHIWEAASGAGWASRQKSPPGFSHISNTLLLTHDVDYLPSPQNRGLPRVLRALLRQTFLRHRPQDACSLLKNYLRAFRRKAPYTDFFHICSQEGRRGGRSSFQWVVARHHRYDPRYAAHAHDFVEGLRQLQAWGGEICLHGSYTASRTPGRLTQERASLEHLLDVPVSGHRQHYLNFHPPDLFREVESAGFRYDLSIGYNDRSGPRAGTRYPYRPYNLEHNRPHNFWEIPFFLMDTTLSTSYRFSSRQAWDHILHKLEGYSGCLAVIWHTEQFGGCLDPGFDDLYWQMLDCARQKGIHLDNPGALLPDLEAAWEATVSDSFRELQHA
ncbi:MAG: hypothetical protein AB1345_09545 [Chloroflexota bacterium]